MKYQLRIVRPGKMPEIQDCDATTAKEASHAARALHLELRKTEPKTVVVPFKETP